MRKGSHSSFVYFYQLLFCLVSSTSLNISEGGFNCHSSISTSYAKAPIVENAEDNLKWCLQKQKIHHIVVSKSFGNAPKDLSRMWFARQCDELLANGITATCESKYGITFMDKWRSNVVNLTRSGEVSCFRSPYGHYMCKINNAVVDFSRMETIGKSRSFRDGFLLVPFSKDDEYMLKGVMADIEGWKFEEVGEIKADIDEATPVFVNSNDDIGNLMHNMNDVITIWSMLWLSQRDPRESVLLNFDGLRKGGPGGKGHRLMYPEKPDALGPFRGYFISWFNTIQKAKDYGDQKVKFREIYFQPTPGFPWVWMDYTIDSSCTFLGPSSMFQSFYLHTRRYWREKFGESSTLIPPTTSTNVLLILRKTDPKKGAGSRARSIANLNELALELSKLDNVNVMTLDLSTLPFEDQYKVSSNSSIIVGMHGAGLGHIFHSSIGNPNCCSLIEIFPRNDQRQGYDGIKVFGNTARHLGLHYISYKNSLPLTSSGESVLDVNAIENLVRKAMYLVRNKPSCLAKGSTI